MLVANLLCKTFVDIKDIVISCSLSAYLCSVYRVSKRSVFIPIKCVLNGFRLYRSMENWRPLPIGMKIVFLICVKYFFKKIFSDLVGSFGIHNYYDCIENWLL